MIFHLIRLQGVSIFEQLLLEEKLLREDSRNFCLLNEGSSPAIVMGISGKPEELIDSQKALDLTIPVIKRFSGGGTVVIDENTLFVTLICNKQEFDFPAYPERIMKWTEGVYQNSLHIPNFSLKENDFAIGNLKCGGNAQYIKKDRWLQHTSFLWDYCPTKMSTLLLPRKTPAYRNGREHKDFLCTLKEHLPSKENFFERIYQYLEAEQIVEHLHLEKVQEPSSFTRRQTTLLSL
jgi:lipoate-protein ligase A